MYLRRLYCLRHPQIQRLSAIHIITNEFSRNFEHNFVDNIYNKDDVYNYRKSPETWSPEVYLE